MLYQDATKPFKPARDSFGPPPSYWTEARRSVFKIWPIVLGNLLEWYEFSVYGYLESHLTKSFFSSNSIFTWMGFAVTFAARPFGGLVLGWIGDKYGRKTSLIISLYGMIFATVGQGCLPTNLCCGEELGYVGIVLLIILRVIQGISAGGEIASVATFLTESVPLRCIGIANATISIGGNTSFFLASAIAGLLNHFLTEDQMDLWGWRIPFLICLPFGLLFAYLRKNLVETLHRESNDKEDIPLTDDEPLIARKQTTLLKNHKMSLLISFVGATGISALWYVGPIYAPSWLDDRTTLPKSTTLFMGAGAQLIALIFSPIAGLLTDCLGVWKVCMIGNLFVLLTGLPAYVWLLEEPNSEFVGFLTISIFFGVAQGLAGTGIYLYCLELFPMHLRATGMGVSYNLAVSYVGGFGPLIAEGLSNISEVSPGWYTSIGGVVSIVGLLLSRVWENGTTRKLTYIRMEPY